MIEVPRTFADAAGRLLPVLRRVTRPEQAARLPAERRPLSRPIGAWLHALLVLDGERERSYVAPDHLARWGVSEDAGWTAAFEQLAPHATAGLRAEGAGFRLAPGDGSGASRLLLPGFSASFGGRVPGAPLFFAPDEDALWIVGDQDPSLPDVLRAAFEAFRAADRPLCPAPLTAPLDLWPDPRASANRALLAAVTYAEQSDQLDELAPEGTRIAGCSLIYERASHTARTRAALAPGPAWLPLVDEVQLASGEVVPFASLGLSAIPGVHPPRYEG